MRLAWLLLLTVTKIKNIDAGLAQDYCDLNGGVWSVTQESCFVYITDKQVCGDANCLCNMLPTLSYGLHGRAAHVKTPETFTLLDDSGKKLKILTEIM